MASATSPSVPAFIRCRVVRPSIPYLDTHGYVTVKT